MKSTKILNNLIQKYQNENSALTENEIKYYVDRFEEVKASKKVEQKDILKYNFNQLEILVNSFSKNIEGEEIYNKNGLIIYLGDTKEKCIKYKEALEKKTKIKYNWCVSVKGKNNKFDYYNMIHGAVFYFIIDNNKGVYHPQHVFVITNLLPNLGYTINFADNKGTKVFYRWKSLIKIIPELSEVPKTVFKLTNISKSERQLNICIGNIAFIGTIIMDILVYFNLIKDKRYF